MFCVGELKQRNYKGFERFVTNLLLFEYISSPFSILIIYNKIFKKNQLLIYNIYINRKRWLYMKYFDSKKETELMKKYGISPDDSEYTRVQKIMKAREMFECNLQNIQEYSELCDFEMQLMEKYIDSYENYKEPVSK